MKINLKKIVKEVAVTLVILFVVANVLSYLRKPTLDSNIFPETKTVLLDGAVFNSAEAKEKPLLVHFWALWCPTCKLEAPNIQSLSKEYEVLSIVVSSGEDNKVKAYMKTEGLDFRVINDKHGHWAKQFKVEAFPTTFIYDANGTLQFTEVGYTTTVGLVTRMKILQ
ncbi:MAG: redoxin domain-containing protein [Sulfurovum sp.]|nr:redoxin domain-containing protein [Sulfurovum sp.]